MTAAVTFAVFLVLLVAQQQAPTPTFRTSTRLVELTVTALDKKGKAVTDLRLEDFTVQENGKTRPIAFFRYDGGPPVEPKASRFRPASSPTAWSSRRGRRATSRRSCSTSSTHRLSTACGFAPWWRDTSKRSLRRPASRYSTWAPACASCTTSPTMPSRSARGSRSPSSPCRCRERPSSNARSSRPSSSSTCSAATRRWKP